MFLKILINHYYHLYPQNPCYQKYQKFLKAQIDPHYLMYQLYLKKLKIQMNQS
jgi:hypothetical protein